MCHLILYEHYIQCGCTINIGFKYKPEWCHAPNGIPFPRPELFEAEKSRIPGRCCDEENWTYGQLDMDAACVDCRRKWSLQRNGLGEVMKRVKFRCGHTKDWFCNARVHCAFRFDGGLLQKDAVDTGDSKGIEDNNDANNEEKTELQLPLPPSWYTYTPCSRQGYSPSTEQDLEQWHRIKAGWTPDFNLLRGQGKVRYTVIRNRSCGNCERAANLDLYDSLMMSPDEDRGGYRKRKPYALDISVEKARKYPVTMTGG
ncbi:predicted protein [Paecilomyces variotii No. 5]|uniref:Uncharacterized protein n=1 Tax=Byssochlamys spectabilis (strain No. 5 / NBRC 109023) TaxID=1356009 RepID=V5I2R6_BYSSN|nr:predicted protein [Paecilomyces variotii No. 5]